jgi:hypothetical protein
MTFVVEELPLEQISYRVSSISLIIIVILPLHHSHLSLLSEVYKIPDQAAHYHLLVLEFWGLKSDTVFGWLQRK